MGEATQPFIYGWWYLALRWTPLWNGRLGNLSLSQAPALQKKKKNQEPPFRAYHTDTVFWSLVSLPAPGSFILSLILELNTSYQWLSLDSGVFLFMVSKGFPPPVIPIYGPPGVLSSQCWRLRINSVGWSWIIGPFLILPGIEDPRHECKPESSQCVQT